jgi:simple sugar transport system substrate-binding protein
MSKIQKVFVGLFSVLMMALAPFNSTLAQTYEPDNPEYTFHVVVQYSPHPFWDTFVNGALAAGKRYNVKVVSAMFPTESIEQQADRIDQVRSLKPDGMAVSISNLQAIKGPTMRAINAGIPVVAVNSPDTSPKDKRIPYLFYTGQSEFLAGQEVARRMLKANPGIKHVMIANQAPGLGVLEQRAGGVKDVMEKRGVKVTVVAITTNPSQILERYRAHWARHPDTDGFVTLSSQPFNKVGRDLFKELGIMSKVTNMTFDMSQDTLEAVKKGEMLGMVDQQQFFYGYIAISMLYMNKKYGFVPADDILTGPFIIDKSNVHIAEPGLKGGWRQ